MTCTSKNIVLYLIIVLHAVFCRRTMIITHALLFAKRDPRSHPEIVLSARYSVGERECDVIYTALLLD